MEGKYSIEVVEMICAEEADGNAQVTAPVEIEGDAKPAPKPQVENDEPTFDEPAPKRRRKRSGGADFMRTNAATNGLLVAILFILFLFMIFKCD